MSENVVPIANAKPKQLWSIQSLSIEFGKNWGGVSKALHGVPPDGEIKGKPAWYVATAAPFLVQVPSATGADGLPKSLDSMDPRDRLDWVKSERELMKMRNEAGELVPRDQHIEELSKLAKSVIRGLDTLGDTLERALGLDGKTVEAIHKHCAEVKKHLYAENSIDDE